MYVYIYIYIYKSIHIFFLVFSQTHIPPLQKWHAYANPKATLGSSSCMHPARKWNIRKTEGNGLIASQLLYTYCISRNLSVETFQNLRDVIKCVNIHVHL